MTDWKFKVGDVLEHKASGERCVVIRVGALVIESKEKSIHEAFDAYELDLGPTYSSKKKDLVEVAYKLVEEELVDDEGDEESALLTPTFKTSIKYVKIEPKESYWVAQVYLTAPGLHPEDQMIAAYPTIAASTLLECARRVEVLYCERLDHD